MTTKIYLKKFLSCVNETQFILYICLDTSLLYINFCKNNDMVPCVNEFVYSWVGFMTIYDGKLILCIFSALNKAVNVNKTKKKIEKLNSTSYC